MKRYYIGVLVLLFLSLSLNLAAQDITIEEIHERYKATVLIPRITATLTVKLISAKGEEREIQAKAYQKSDSGSESEASRLFIFEYPPSIRDTGILIQSYANTDENVMWMYLPAVKRVKRIALATSGGGYFMGSDFSYNDFIPKSRDDFTHEYLGEVIIDGTPCYAIKEIAATQKQRQDLKLSYMLNYYRKSDFVMFGRDYYDLAGELLKEYRIKTIQVLDQKYLYPIIIEMKNVQTGHKSILTMSDINTDPIPDSYFTTRFLENR
ncbi:MAG: outer membrane lipoprotein-sorting protein [Spirochaetes bacterium]|nr:outer membrane lipoprotein-sorting protein [Spirochaetota bacterium]